jgi:hypothetical protein
LNFELMESTESLVSALRSLTKGAGKIGVLYSFSKSPYVLVLEIILKATF